MSGDVLLGSGAKVVATDKFDRNKVLDKWHAWKWLEDGARASETDLQNIMSGFMSTTLPVCAPAKFRALEYAMTLEEVAKKLGVSRERARQIEVSALRKLREAYLTREGFYEAGASGVNEGAYQTRRAQQEKRSEKLKAKASARAREKERKWRVKIREDVKGAGRERTREVERAKKRSRQIIENARKARERRDGDAFQG